MDDDSPYDIQTKNCLYEIKGCRCWTTRKNESDKKLRLSKYYIIIDNHKELKLESDKLSKIAKYVFLLQIDGRKIWKTMSWEAVDMFIRQNNHYKRDEHEYCYLSLNAVW